MPQAWQSIKPISHSTRNAAQYVIDQKTKPQGSLGYLEEVAVLLASVLGDRVANIKPSVAIFAADHGIAEEGVSAFPQEVTAQMVANFLAGGAAVNVLAGVAEAELLIVDVGVKADFPDHDFLLKRSVAKGTANFANASAMSTAECLKALAAGRDAVDILWERGCNVFAGGEMGIGNTTAASAIMHAISKMPVEECVGRGTGVSDEGISRKVTLIGQACHKHFAGEKNDPIHILACVGGFEIAALVGAYLQAAHRSMALVIDGFIATTAFLVASKLEPYILEYAIFAHQSGELGHAKLLDYLGVKPLLQMQMRLGEGSGAALALPLIKAAAKVYTDMASFESAGVSQKS